ncbi:MULTISPECIES: xanthine dehydrogenase family protein molybdopterin-binding subunit [Bradyrhizobium]|uniref:Isoquinoline 1-oxidoreductase, beta subunit n=2 Tax=Bradyrhizobium TaxID=374 RepID=A0ABY0PCB0_9BRAD|nr:MULTISPECIES: xanthine dehydrogenase family protein molybdopterin-binding subunit [Bradyrhizobium]SDH67810.1 isoquinoline 1-oxidoreductase, beta subunit [Bradyrhizobium ottawaense]SEE15433.1 isoquinoline 1-oxidoreductase, beta subunit [Bradyrhizobium lablabi]
MILAEKAFLREKISGDVSRRTLLTTGLAGGFLLAFHLPLSALAPNEPVQPPDATESKFAPNAFIRIDQAGHTTLVMPQVEMGQGVYTAIAMILAEELDAVFPHVTLEHAPPNDELYGNPVFGLQVTGNSNSIRAWWTQLRKGGAGARAMLVQAAAQQWQVDPAGCTAANGEVIHKESGRRLSYGALAQAAGSQTPPRDVALKDPNDFVLIGKPLKRLDTPDKANGKAVYGIDAILPGMKFATVAACPVFGGKVGKVDDSAAKKIPGVQKIVVLDDMVAVVGDHMWAAKKGLDALVIDWNEGPNAHVSSKDIWRDLRAASEKNGVVAKSEGDIAKGLATGERLDASYELPFLAHATMEPVNATVHVTRSSCEIWTGTQIMTRVQSEAAKAAGLPVEKVTVNNHLLGGGFGRKLEPDMVVAAVRVAKQVDGPVKVVWTREEDIQHDVYRPVYRDTISATLSAGKIVGWRYKVSGAAVIARWLPPAFQKGIDIDAVDSAVDAPYDIPNFHVEYVRAEPPAVPTGFWRGVGPNNNVFAIESFMDELARKVGKDPIDFRRGMLGKNPRLLAALNLVAEKSGWGQPLPARIGRGVSVQPSFGSFIATVVEAEVDEQGEVLLHRITSAVDTGIAVNPDTIMAQLEGGLIFGLTAALYGEITIDKGRVQQSNFHDYRMLRIDQVPKVEVHVIKSGEAPGGIGETGVTAGPPALRNAIYAATGVALRRLPIDRSLIAVGRKA